MENIQHSNRSVETIGSPRAFVIRHSSFLFLLLTPFLLHAQTPPHLPPGGLIQLQVQQPGVDVTTPVTATATFDPPVVRPGEKAFYRVTLDSTESSILWPNELSTPDKLKFGASARGTLTQLETSRFRPQTSFVYEVQPTATGHFTVTNFSVYVSGVSVEIPAASLDVADTNTGLPSGQRLALEISETNVFLGQPFRVRVMLPAEPGTGIEPLSDIQFNGDGLMADKTALREYAGQMVVNGELRTTLACEMILTPISAGPLKFSAQAYTAGREFSTPVVIHGPATISGGQPRHVLLISDPVEMNVRPLPVEGELPGFTGAIGKFFGDPPQLSTNRLNVGESVQLSVKFHGEGELSRFAPPAAPRSRDWDIIADPPPAISFTLIPLTDDVHETPAIPFCYFDPTTAKYVDLTVPSMPVTVVGAGLPAELPTFDDEGKAAAPLKLSALATAPGKRVWSLIPPQQRGWFPIAELVPVVGFLALWQWDRRRRYLEAHPEIVRRAQARRAFRREKQQLEKAGAAGDAAAFVQHAARAMSIAVAPHFPANPRALVGGDVLAQLDDIARNGQAGETVKNVFDAANAQYAGKPQTPPDLMSLRPGVNAVLQTLEEKL